MAWDRSKLESSLFHVVQTKTDVSLNVAVIKMVFQILNNVLFINSLDFHAPVYKMMNVDYQSVIKKIKRIGIFGYELKLNLK